MCPWCGGRVPFGGGRTAKHAKQLKDEALAVSRAADMMKEAGEATGLGVPVSTESNLVSFIADGIAHASAFHEYAHKRTMVPPDWAQAGWWSRHAKELLSNLSASLTEGGRGMEFSGSEQSEGKLTHFKLLFASKNPAEAGQYQIRLFELPESKTRDEIAQGLRKTGMDVGPEQIIPGDHTPIHIQATARTMDGRVQTWDEVDIVPTRLSRQEVDDYLSAKRRERFVASNVQEQAFGWKRMEEWS